jgi:peptidoglycan pentaglycine glycine transferase (the first glycine)
VAKQDTNATCIIALNRNDFNMEIKIAYNLDENQQSRWDEFWSKANHSHPRQHHIYDQVEKHIGKVAVYTWAEVDGDIVCLAVFGLSRPCMGKMFRRNAICLRGPVFDEIEYGLEFMGEICKKFRKFNVGSIMVSPCWMLPDAEPLLDELSKQGFAAQVPKRNGLDPTARVDIKEDAEKILASFSAKARRDVRLASKKGITVECKSDEETSELFLRRLNSMLAGRNLTKMNSKEFQSIYEYVLKDSDLGCIITAYKDDVFLAGAMVLRDDSVAYLMRFVVDPKPLKELVHVRIAPAVWFEAMKWAKDKGCSRLDVEGYDPLETVSDGLYRVVLYKKALNPVPFERIGQYYYVSDKMVFYMYKCFDFPSKAWRKIKSLSRNMQARVGNVSKDNLVS